MCNKDRRRKYASTPRTRLEVALRRPKIPPMLEDVPTITFLKSLTIVTKSFATTRNLLGDLLSQGDCGCVYRKLGDDSRVIKTIVSAGRFNSENPLIPGNKRNCHFYDNLRIAVKMGKVGIGPVIHEVWLSPAINNVLGNDGGIESIEGKNIFIEMDFVRGQTLNKYITHLDASDALDASKSFKMKKYGHHITEEQKKRFTPQLYAVGSEAIDRMFKYKVDHGDCHSHNIIVEELKCAQLSTSIKSEVERKDRKKSEIAPAAEVDWKVTMIDFDFAQENNPDWNGDQEEFEKLYDAWIGSDAKRRHREWKEQTKD